MGFRGGCREWRLVWRGKCLLSVGMLTATSYKTQTLSSTKCCWTHLAPTATLIRAKYPDNTNVGLCCFQTPCFGLEFIHLTLVVSVCFHLLHSLLGAGCITVNMMDTLKEHSLIKHALALSFASKVFCCIVETRKQHKIIQHGNISSVNSGRDFELHDLTLRNG